jgi:hypothetical protein
MPCFFTPFTRRIPGARSGLKSPRSAASFASGGQPPSEGLSWKKRVLSLFEADPVPRHHGFVESEAGLRAVDKFANGVIVRSLRTSRGQAVRDRRFRLFEIRRLQNGLGLRLRLFLDMPAVCPTAGPWLFQCMLARLWGPLLSLQRAIQKITPIYCRKPGSGSDSNGALNVRQNCDRSSASGVPPAQRDLFVFESKATSDNKTGRASVSKFGSLTVVQAICSPKGPWTHRLPR